MKSLSTPLQAFDAPGDLISYLHTSDGDLDTKDLLLGELVILAQSPRHRELGTALLWLGLWPGLDAVYRRRLKHFHRTPEELVSLIGEAFSTLIANLDLHVVNRVAATLVRSTERELMSVRRRDWEEEARRATDAELARHIRELVAAELNTAELIETRLGIRTGQRFTERLSELRGWLLPMVGEDADLVICVLVAGESQNEAGDRFGLSHDAARKRVQRALGSIRDHLDEQVSHSAPSLRVCSTPGR